MGKMGYIAGSHLATAILTVVALPPALVYLALIVIHGRKRVEWARRAYSYYLPAVAAFTLYCLFHSTIHALFTVYTSFYKRSQGSNNTGWHLRNTLRYLIIFSRLVDGITEMLVFLCLLFFLTGLHEAQTGAFKLKRIVCRTSYAIVFILSASAGMNLCVSLYNENFNDVNTFDPDYYTSGDGFPTTFLAGLRLNMAFVAIVWVVSFALLAGSLWVAKTASSERPFKHVSKYVAVCCVLWFLRATFNLVMTARDGENARWQHGHGLVTKMNIVNVPATIWTMAALLVLLYRLGVDGLNGLWVKDQETANRKAFNVNKPRKNFQNIEIPLPAETVRTDLSPSSQNISQAATPGTAEDISPLSPQSNLALSPPPPFPVSPCAAPFEPTNQSLSIELVEEPQHQRWDRPPSIAPPSHEELMGLGHQADGYTPPPPLPYPEKN